EVADRVAKEAILTGRDTPLGLPSSDLNAVWKNNNRKEFIEWFSCTDPDKGIFYTSNFASFNPKPWFDKLKVNRRTIVSINRLRSGHTSLRASLFKYNIVHSPTCLCGECEETPNHIFFQCSRFDEPRRSFLKSLQDVLGVGPY
ncbi:GSCOCG00000161001-RA-CDS, partial [Cotesia congregata]